MRPTIAIARGALLIAGLGAGCVAEGTVPGPPYEVMVLDRVDDVTNGGPSAFVLQRRTLETVTNFSRLEGPVFRVRQGGTLSATVVGDGDAITSGRFEGGRDPDLRYVVEDGSAVPRDDATLFMFSAAYQFEHVLPRLVESSAPDVGTVFTTRGPMNIFFGPQVVITTNGVENTERDRTNAFFNSRGWQFGIERTSPLERVPLGADPRVIAHELGHAVFQIVFFGGDEVPCDRAQAETNAVDSWFPGRLSAELVVNGLNEGFADWMSFASTGGTNPLESGNFPPLFEVDLNKVRILTEDNFRWSQVFKLEGLQTEVGCFNMYCLGTLFARSLVATYLAQGHAIADEDARHEFSRAVVAALRGTAARMQSIGLPPPAPELARCEQRAITSSRQDPPVIGAFMEAFLDGLAPEQATLLCDELGERFEEGFPMAFRKRCTQ